MKFCHAWWRADLSRDRLSRAHCPLVADRYAKSVSGNVFRTFWLFFWPERFLCVFFPFLFGFRCVFFMVCVSVAFFLRFLFRPIRKSRFLKFGAFPKRFLRIGNANHVSLNSAVFARGGFGNVICVSEAFPETFGKTPLDTQKAYQKRDSRFRPHFGGQIRTAPSET